MRILVVDDETDLQEQICRVLVEQNYICDTAENGEEALERLFSDPYDLVILDIMLPGKDGFEVLQEIRKDKIATPVLMLTARGEIEDRVRGLDLGADDYLAKPFSVSELLARIRVLLRRADNHSSAVLTMENIQLNTATREVFRGKEQISLTPREFSIFEFLLYNRNRAISRFTMAEHVWGDEFDPFIMSNNIDVHIKNLRKKIGEKGGRLILTVRGIGYIIKDSNPDENTK